MFCPQEAVWGNVADWVSGLGSLLAVIVALWIATGERRERKALQNLEDRDRRTQLSLLSSEVSAAFRSFAEACAHAIDVLDAGGDLSHSDFWQWMSEAKKKVRKVQSLSDLPVEVFSFAEEFNNLTRGMSGINGLPKNEQAKALASYRGLAEMYANVPIDIHKAAAERMAQERFKTD